MLCHRNEQPNEWLMVEIGVYYCHWTQPKCMSIGSTVSANELQYLIKFKNVSAISIQKSDSILLYKCL